MLKQLILKNWKSFCYAELPLDPLTILIGTNASGKSNVIEALEFLKRIVKGKGIEVALVGDEKLSSIRGGVEWAALRPKTQFTLKSIVEGEDDNTDYIYSITVQTQPFLQTLELDIIRQENNVGIINNYYLINSGIQEETLDKKLTIYSDKSVISYPLDIDKDALVSSELIINLFRYSIGRKNHDKDGLNKNLIGINKTINTLNNIFIFNPIPFNMRDYSPLSETLESDASNIAGLLAALPDQQKAEVESTLSTYIKDLPEGDIQKVWAEKVGRFGTDAMLYCHEEWKPGHITEIDARSMSDGTLRFLAILTALLTRPEGSQLVIEEIDNGLHPSRAELLVRILREIGSKRKIDILLTTHNPALLDALGPEIVPFVVVAHRDKETGESKLTLLEDIENLPLLLASGTLGRLATKGAIEKSLSDNK
ncbi:MAG: AAA family ATPase [Nostoc sp.]|uniref:AAA family ATPase n=1 Tax=Nostoc sp. TaxID=1180 RepID=UPI002FFACA29